MEGNYVYRPLSARDSIRVLELQPAQNLTGPLVGSLQEVDMEDIQYMALSYSWAMEDREFEDTLCGRKEVLSGDSSLTKPLILENAEVLIGENLRDALRRLRERSTRPSYFWVDAICINQHDNAEKSVQVAQMGRIYENAAQVVAWLGEGDEYSNQLAFLALQCLAAEQSVPEPVEFAEREQCPWLLKHEWVIPWYKMNFYQNDAPQKCDVCKHRNISGDSPPDNLIAAAFHHLSRRRYMRRLWVVQETMKPRTGHVSYQWGSYVLPGNPLELLSFRYSVYWNVERGVGELSKYRRRDHQPEILNNRTNRSLWSVLAYCRTKLCFDPRDKLYGVLGIVPDCAEDIIPDYRFSLPEVYGQLVRYTLKRRQIGLVLVNGRMTRVAPADMKLIGHRFDAELPTWMPDLSSWLTSSLDLELTPGEPRALDQEDPAALWDYVDPAISDDSLVLSCYLCYYGTLSTPNDPDDAHTYSIRWEAGSHDRVATDSICNPTIRCAPVYWDHQRDYVKYLEGNFTPPDPGLARCILCSAHPEHDFFRPILRPDAGRPGRWQIIGTWGSSFHSQRGQLRHAPGERRLYHLS